MILGYGEIGTKKWTLLYAVEVDVKKSRFQILVSNTSKHDRKLWMAFVEDITVDPLPSQFSESGKVIPPGNGHQMKDLVLTTGECICAMADGPGLSGQVIGEKILMGQDGPP